MPTRQRRDSIKTMETKPDEIVHGEVNTEVGTPEKIKITFATATRIANGYRQRLCKNAVVEVVPIEGSKDDRGEQCYDLKGDGCRNGRRNGSAWCQDCSDKHRQTCEK